MLHEHRKKKNSKISKSNALIYQKWLGVFVFERTKTVSVL